MPPIQKVSMGGHRNLPCSLSTEVRAVFLLMPNSVTHVILFLFQSAVGFEYQGKTEKHPSQKGKVGRWSPL